MNTVQALTPPAESALATTTAEKQPITQSDNRISDLQKSVSGPIGTGPSTNLARVAN